MANGTDIAKAYVQIIPSAEGIQGKLTDIMGGEANNAGRNAGGIFSKIFGGVAKAGLIAAGASAAITTGLVAATGKVAEYGDNIDKMSQKLGMSAQAYQEWDAIMQHSGTSIDAMQSGMKTLANAVENGNEAFERLGITQEQIAGMSNEELFSTTITALQNVGNETERTYLAGQLLGRGATELGALLNTSAEETEAMRQRVHELGGVMSDEAVAAAAAYQDSLQDMQTAFSGLSRNLVSSFMPSITTVMDGLAEIFTGNSANGISMISSGISELAANITAKLPEFIDVASGIINALVSALVDNMPQLIESGIQILTNLIVGIITHIPQLIASIPKIIAAIVQGVVSGFPQIISAGRNLLTAFKNGVISAVGSLASAGLNLVKGIWNGISSGLGWIKGKIQGWVGNVVSFIKNLFGIHSPSTVMRDEVGRFMALGIGEGFTGAMDGVERDMLDSMPDLGSFRTTYSLTANGTGNGTGGIVGEIAAIRDDIRNMKIYLDTGKLIGAVDGGLGVNYAAAQRRALA